MVRKVHLIQKICSTAHVERVKKDYPNLTFEELIALMSWLNLMSDIKQCVESTFSRENFNNESSDKKRAN